MYKRQLLSVGVANVDVKCDDYELLQFSPPSDMTCGQYMKPYLLEVGTGYLTDESATDTCSFCQISTTNAYLASVNSYYGDRWRNYGIFICYIGFNYIAGVFLYWLARVPKKNKKLSKN